MTDAAHPLFDLSAPRAGAPMPGDVEAPSALSSLLELRAPFAALSLMRRAPHLLRAPRGEGRPVMLLPGFLADETSMRPLSAYLSYLGYKTGQWGLGRNRGDVDEDIRRFGAQLTGFQKRHHGAPVSLVGWSLGGVVAREAARLYPDAVREVITLGTPIIGGPKYTSVGAAYAAYRGIDMDAFERDVHDRNSVGLSQPLTSIYSKTDGVVGWKASVDVYNAHARNIEVTGSHFGLGVSASAWLAVATTLAMPVKRRSAIPE